MSVDAIVHKTQVFKLAKGENNTRNRYGSEMILILKYI
jgi:hypothetical protein